MHPRRDRRGDLVQRNLVIALRYAVHPADVYRRPFRVADHEDEVPAMAARFRLRRVHGRFRLLQRDPCRWRRLLFLCFCVPGAA